MQTTSFWPVRVRLPGVALAALLCVGCGGGGGSNEPATPTPPAPTIVQAVRPTQDWQSSPQIPIGTYVFQSQQEFAAVWNGAPPPLGDTRSPYVPPPVPSGILGINFQTSTAVAVSLGFGNFCHLPRIGEISSTAGTLLVKYTMLDPAVSQCTLAALHITQMVEVMVIPKFTGPVTFQATVVSTP